MGRRGSSLMRGNDPSSIALTASVSIAFIGRDTVSQHEPETENGAQEVPLVIMTHSASEGATQTAVAQIDTLPRVRPGTVRMRVLD